MRKGVLHASTRILLFCRVDCYAWTGSKLAGPFLSHTPPNLSATCTQVCVQTTMREGNDRGYECCLVGDSTGSYNAFFKEAVLSMVAAQGGIVGWTALTDEVVQSLAVSEVNSG